MSRRRKSVTCVLCEKRETYEKSAVCRECYRAWAAGQPFLAQTEAGEAELKKHSIVTSFRAQTDLGDEHFTLRAFPDSSLFIHGIVELGNLQRADGVVGSHIRIGVTEEDLRADGLTPAAFLLMTEAQAEGIRKIMQFIHQSATYEYRSAYRSGSSALLRLANAESSPEDFDAQYAKVMGEQIGGVR